MPPPSRGAPKCDSILRVRRAELVGSTERSEGEVVGSKVKIWGWLALNLYICYNSGVVMDYARKLEILAKADFSEWRSNWELPGIGNLFFGMRGSLSYMADHHDEKYISRLQHIICNYNNLIIFYSKIPFEEMDRSDNDFEFLFNFRDQIENLGDKVEKFVDKCIGSKFKASRDWKEYQELDYHINILFSLSSDYRDVVLERNGIKFSQPAPNNSPDDSI